MARQRWRHWVAVVSVVVALGVVTVTLGALWRYANNDQPEVIDHPLVVRTSNAACLIMRKSVHSLAPPAEAPIPARVKAIRQQNEAVNLMLDQIRRVGPDLVAGDVPLPEWLNDWEALVRARKDYADALEAGRQKQLELPVDAEGVPIIKRMNEVGLTCTVPSALTSTG